MSAYISGAVNVLCASAMPACAVAAVNERFSLSDGSIGVQHAFSHFGPAPLGGERSGRRSVRLEREETETPGWVAVVKSKRLPRTTRIRHRRCRAH